MASCSHATTAERLDSCGPILAFREAVPMWNNAVAYLHTGLQTTIHPLVAMAHEHPTTTLGVALLFAVLVAMIAAEIADGRANAARADEAPPGQR